MTTWMTDDLMRIAFTRMQVPPGCIITAKQRNVQDGAVPPVFEFLWQQNCHNHTWSQLALKRYHHLLVSSDFEADRAKIALVPSQYRDVAVVFDLNVSNSDGT